MLKRIIALALPLLLVSQTAAADPCQSPTRFFSVAQGAFTAGFEKGKKQNFFCVLNVKNPKHIMHQIAYTGEPYAVVRYEHLRDDHLLFVSRDSAGFNVALMAMSQLKVSEIVHETSRDFPNFWVEPDGAIILVVTQFDGRTRYRVSMDGVSKTRL